MLLTGEYGCGKTLLSRTLLEQLDPERYDIAILPHPNLNPVELLQELLCQFGYEGNEEESNKGALLRKLEECLLFNKSQGRSTIILVDEAQMVTDPLTLEEIRLLLNFQQSNSFLLTLIIMGQPELKEKIEKLPQLKERLSIRYHLNKFSPNDTKAYIRHRLKIAGVKHEIFTSRAESMLVQNSEGIPRRINNLADMALLAGYGMKSPIIDDTIMLKVIEDSGF
jgi:general secretion pathway protein A